MTTFATSKVAAGPRITRNDVSQNVFNTLNSVRYSKNASRIQRNSKKTKTVQDETSESPRPKFLMLKSIEEQIEFNQKLKNAKKESNVSKSLNGYPKGIFVQTKHDRNQFRQWKAVEKLRKSEFSNNYM